LRAKKKLSPPAKRGAFLIIFARRFAAGGVLFADRKLAHPVKKVDAKSGDL
jgi:hypothetical protein